MNSRAPSGGDDDRREVSGGGERDHARVRVDLGVDERRELRGLDLLDERVEVADHRARAGAGDRQRAHRAAQLPHRRRRRQPASDHVADDHPDPPAVERERVVPVAADLELLARGLVERRDAEALVARRLARQQALLQRVRDRPGLLLQALDVSRARRSRSRAASSSRS